MPVTVEVPVADGVNVTVHLPALNVQDGALNVPAAPVLVQETVPVGVVGVPGEMSATVAVHDVALPTTVVEDAQTTVVLVALGLTVIAKDVGPLPEWILSPP